jgi:branched-chain amino acid transport system ATP-binding protein
VSLLAVESLHVFLGPSHVLQGVSFDVAEGGVTALLGRNGVGKTTAIRAVLGLVERRGRVALAGDEIGREQTHRIVRRGVGYVPEDRDVFHGLTVAENLRLAERNGSARYENRLLLIDEPTKGLAPLLVTEVAKALERAAEIATVLLVEQNLGVVQRLARDVVVLDQGRVVHAGTAAEFLGDPALVRRHLGVATAEAA